MIKEQKEARYSPQLVLAAQMGDRIAILELLKSSQPDIRRYARANCVATDIDDAVQESMWLLYKRVGSLRAVASFPAWLFEIVRRECRRLARRMFGQHITMDAIENSEDFSLRPTYELQLDLVAAIHSLPDHYRLVIVMRDIEELTIEEMANTIGVSREAVKARLNRARTMVRDYLRE